MCKSHTAPDQEDAQGCVGLVPRHRLGQKLSQIVQAGKERVKIFAIDETGITVAGMQAFLFIAYEPFENRVLGLHFARNPNSISVEIFLRDLRLCEKLFQY